MVICFFGMFYQNLFMKTVLCDVKVSYFGKVHMFFLSFGYQLMLLSFLAMPGICLSYGSMFEIAECADARMIPLLFHNLGEFLAVVFHMLLNIDRLFLVFRPNRAEGRATKIWFFVTLLLAFVLCGIYVEIAHHEDNRKSIAFGSICLVNVLNLLIEFKLYYYTSVVFIKTIGLVPLERRFELSSSVIMIRCFLPASTSALVFKFSVVTFYSLSYLLRDPVDLPPYYFFLNLLWNLDCTLFPWLFLQFRPSNKQKREQFLKILSTNKSTLNHNECQNHQQLQHEHFNQLKNMWNVGA